MHDLHKEISNLLRDIQRFSTTEYYRTDSHEVAHQLKVMNGHLTRLSSRLDIFDETQHDPEDNTIRRLKRKVMVLQDREYYAYNHFLTGNLARIIGLIWLVLAEVEGGRFEKIRELATKLKEENGRLHNHIIKLLEGGPEGRANPKNKKDG